MTGIANRWSTGMSKKPWICPACRSTVTTRSAPAAVIRSATNFALIGVRGLTLRSCRAYPKYGMMATIDPADARLSASIMIKSSIRFWFTGELVGCTTKQFTPRTFSPISTKISPSENVVTSAAPGRTSTQRQIDSASSRFALPEKMVSALIMRASLPQSLPRSLLGRKDSNLRMREPKSRDLPLVDAPSKHTNSRQKVRWI